MKATERHKLKEDEFARSVARAKDVVQSRQGDITKIAIALLVLILAVAGYSWWRSSGEASANQALAGLGCRPSPSFIAMALDRIGFAHVYGTTAPPQHPDFLFEWRNSLDVSRDGHNLRCVFIASRHPIHRPHLVDLVSRD